MRGVPAAEAEKRALIERLSHPVRRNGRGEDRARPEHHPACGSQRTDGSARLSLSQHALHQQGPRHQPAGGALGEHADRHPEGDIRALIQLPPATRLSHPLPGHRFSGRCARQHRRHHLMGRLIGAIDAAESPAFPEAAKPSVFSEEVARDLFQPDGNASNRR